MHTWLQIYLYLSGSMGLSPINQMNAIDWVAQELLLIKIMPFGIHEIVTSAVPGRSIGPTLKLWIQWIYLSFSFNWIYLMTQSEYLDTTVLQAKAAFFLF